MYRPLPVGWNRKLQLPDLVVFGLIGLILYGVIATAQRWQESYQPDVALQLSTAALPLYSLYSVFRALIAYALSLGFTLIFGYFAAKSRSAERIIVPLLDIGQSIPVLGFLPGLVLGLVAVFPNTNFGLELACIVMIFTGQVWNMTFSYISSLKAVPPQLYEMADNVGLNRLQTLARIELPCAATGLAWNSLMSMAGGWFFLTVCESFSLGDRSFRLPGLGSYMAYAIERGDVASILAGATAMVLVILFMDFVIWRPIIAWTARFRLSESPDAGTEIPFMSLLLKDSPFLREILALLARIVRRTRQEPVPTALLAPLQRAERIAPRRALRAIRLFPRSRLFSSLVTVALAVAGFVLAGKIFILVQNVRWTEWREILVGTLYTFLRVALAITLASLWAIPAGIWIGLSPRLTRLFQPVVQLGASFPAPMLYPLALAAFAKAGLGLGISSSLLMLLGVQWYVLFNVLAGATGISGDLRETFRLIGLSRRTQWLKLYLPSVFPMLVTGWVTASGGAWNASIVAEFIQYKGATLKTQGLGASISEATSSGDFERLAACLIVMVATVITLNRSVWSRLYGLAETRFRFER